MAIPDTIIRWAEAQESIRAIIMTGSRAGKGSIDELSDYDLAVFTFDADKYIDDDTWMREISEVLVYVADQTYDDLGPAIANPWSLVPEQIQLATNSIPTRLVIFRGGIKVDFAFYPLMSLDGLTRMQAIPFAYDLGYKVLLDKDEVAKDLPAPTFTIPVTEKPLPEEFDRVVREFFFEVYHVAKHLHRNDLWHAKFRDWSTKEFLLKMIEWNELARHDWTYDVQYLGKRMKKWISLTTWAALQKTFGHFDAVDGWIALEATIELFRKLATQTAQLLEYEYPHDVDKGITTFVLEQVRKINVI